MHVVRAGRGGHELEQLAEVQRVVAPDPDRSRHEDEDAARGGAGLDVGRRHRVDDLPDRSQLLEDGVAALELLPLERHHGVVGLTVKQPVKGERKQSHERGSRCELPEAKKRERGKERW